MCQKWYIFILEALTHRELSNGRGQKEVQSARLLHQNRSPFYDFFSFS